jgi:hypothetical protein
MRKRKSVFGLHRRVRIACEPLPWSAPGDSKLNKKEACFTDILFYIQNTQTYGKCFQKVSKRVSLFRGWRVFGGSWRTFGAPTSFGWVSDTKKEATAPPKCSQEPKITSKLIPKVENDIANWEFRRRGRREGKSQIGNLGNVGKARGNRKWEILVMWETPGEIADEEFR